MNLAAIFYSVLNRARFLYGLCLAIVPGMVLAEIFVDSFEGRVKIPLVATWQWQLSGSINTEYDVQVYDVDLFDTPEETIQLLKGQEKWVICYFSAGSWEDWREDADSFPQNVLGQTLSGWPDEKWLDIRSQALRSIMMARLDLALSKGCDGVEPDNVDAYQNDSGFALTAQNQMDYNLFLVEQSHLRGLLIGLKNNLEQVVDQQPYFDFAVNEQCHQYQECHLLLPFIENHKPVFHVEYDQRYRDDESARQQLCNEMLSLQFSSLILPVLLDDSFRYTCQ